MIGAEGPVRFRIGIDGQLERVKCPVTGIKAPIIRTTGGGEAVNPIRKFGAVRFGQTWSLLRTAYMDLFMFG